MTLNEYKEVLWKKEAAKGGISKNHGKSFKKPKDLEVEKAIDAI